MSNPDQPSLSGSLSCTKEADKLRHAMKGWVEMSGNEAGGVGGDGGNAPGSRSAAVQSVATEPACLDSPRRTVNH